ncbi:MAG: hypothetical protein Q9211_005974 [Gyalolechia sp. 1 TL-2023]
MIRRPIKSFLSKPSLSSASTSKSSFYSKLKSIFSTSSSKSPTEGTQEDAPYFDPSPNSNTDTIKTRACEQVIGYQFHQPLLLWEALHVHNSSPSTPRYVEGNKRLAIVGDKILDLLLALKWYPTWTDRRAFSTLRYDVTSNKSLENAGNINQLDRYLIFATETTSLPPKMLSAAVEAIVGASYLDGGMKAAETVVQNMGISALEGTTPKASFNNRTRWPHVHNSLPRQSVPRRSSLD